jgi:hypothetical protein
MKVRNRKEEVGWRLKRQVANLCKTSWGIVVYPSSIGDRGLWASSPPFIRLRDAQLIDVAKSIVDCLDLSQDHWPPTKPMRSNSASFLRAVKFSSWKTFDPLASVVVERSETGAMEFTSLRRKGENFVPVDRTVSRIRANASLDKLAKALGKAIEKSETAYVPRRAS